MTPAQATRTVSYFSNSYEFASHTSHEVDLSELQTQRDAEVIGRLTLVRGIGPWTAQMYLMFRLHRPDVWPVGDLGERAGFAKIQGLAAPPGPKELEPLGERYRPWRSAAAFYCWRALAARGENGPDRHV